MKQEFTCIVCPLGCGITVITDANGTIESITGNTCPRGADYVRSECTDPRRTVTSTMKCDSGDVIPVKTDNAIPKDKIFECIRIINSHTASLPVQIGDVLIKDVYGANIVATQNK